MQIAVETLKVNLLHRTTFMHFSCVFELEIRALPQGVTPEKVPQKFSNFWRKDVKAHRNYYKTLKTGRGDDQKLLNELQAMGLAKVIRRICTEAYQCRRHSYFFSLQFHFLCFTELLINYLCKHEMLLCFYSSTLP
jgi:hypothetical protein